jgi:hypothetical protein
VLIPVIREHIPRRIAIACHFSPVVNRRISAEVVECLVDETARLVARISVWHLAHLPVASPPLEEQQIVRSVSVFFMSHMHINTWKGQTLRMEEISFVSSLILSSSSFLI